MNRKRKLNDLYKGVFRNDKKSCLIDLKPLDKKREIEKNRKEEEVEHQIRNNSHNHNIIVDKIENKSKALNVNLKVSKNAGFGSFFKRLREEVIDIFVCKDDYISFDNLINSEHIKNLFNNKSVSKNFPLERDLVNLAIEINKKKEKYNPESYDTNEMGCSDFKNPLKISAMRKKTYEDNLPIEEDIEILYDDEAETIYKKKKSIRNKNQIIENNSFNINIPSGTIREKINFHYDLYDSNTGVNYSKNIGRDNLIDQEYLTGIDTQNNIKYSNLQHNLVCNNFDRNISKNVFIPFSNKFNKSEKSLFEESYDEPMNEIIFRKRALGNLNKSINMNSATDENVNILNYKNSESTSKNFLKNPFINLKNF